VEVVIMLAVLGLAAGWRFTPPPRAVPIAQPIELTTHLHGSGMMAELSISDPRNGGLATLQLTPTEAQIEEPRSVTLSLAVPNLAPIKLEAIEQGQGKWTTNVPPLSIMGQWKVKVEVRVSDFDLVSLPGTIVVK
jgi:copper transport protein